MIAVRMYGLFLSVYYQIRIKMIIGHIPSGYIYSKLLANKLAGKRINLHLLILIGVTGAIAPDFDWLYFYFVDDEKHLHHTYWTHYPIAWLGLLLIFSVWYRYISKKSYVLLGVVFSAAGFMHLLLDSVVGNIWWFAPFIDKPYSMFTVSELHEPWWLNFILHWSFLLELLLMLWAIILWQRKPV